MPSAALAPNRPELTHLPKSLWEYFTTVPRLDGDGRPISLTLSNGTRGVVRDFRIVSPPFWSNTVSDSSDVVYDGMYN